MFFIGVFGIENKQKEIKHLNTIHCNKCNTTATGRLIKQFSFFHFFFIPLFKWNETYYVICDRCNTIYTISKEKGKSIETGEISEITYWDLNEVKNNYSSIRRCKCCGREVDNNFMYCPYCGEKID